MAASAKPLFRAISGQAPAAASAPLLGEAGESVPDVRDPLDYDPTPPDATAAFMAAEIDHIRAHGARVWEPAVGAGHMARVIAAHGFEVVGTDVVDRGWPGVRIASFYDVAPAPAPVQITNPPYCEVNARDGHGRWLWHALSLKPGYVALLLNADWAAARINGMDRLFAEHPPSLELKCCWKIDFRGKGAPPQRNSWFVWDTNRPPVGPNAWVARRLYREVPDRDQGTFDLGGMLP